MLILQVFGRAIVNSLKHNWNRLDGGEQQKEATKTHLSTSALKGPQDHRMHKQSSRAAQDLFSSPFITALRFLGIVTQLSAKPPMLS